MYKLYFSLVLGILLTGCATVPPAPMPEINLGGGSKVGVLIDIGSNPVHSHVGTTVFNNFEKTYGTVQWDTASQISSMVVSKLRKENFEVIDLAQVGIQPDHLDELVVAKNKEWQLGEGKQDALSKLDALGVSSVVLIREEETLASLECTGGPCNSFMISGQGLFTRSFLGIANYFAVAAYETDIYVLKPYADLSKCPSFQDHDRMKSMMVNHEVQVGDIKNVTQAEWQSVKKFVIGYMDRSTSKVAALLKKGCAEKPNE